MSFPCYSQPDLTVPKVGLSCARCSQYSSNRAACIKAMVLGILTAIAACPAIIGTTEAVRQGQRKSAKEKHRGAKSNLIVCCPSHVIGSKEIHGREIVLCNNKV